MIEQKLNNIRILFLNNKYDEALCIAKELIADDLENDELDLELAKIYFAKQNYKNAESLFLKLQKNKVFFVISTEMLQKIYKMLGLYSKSIVQFYKLNRECLVTQENIEDAIDAVIALRRYDTFFKIMFIAKYRKIYSEEYINIRFKEIYKEIIKLISEYNGKYLYDSVKKLYGKIIKYIPQSEKKIRNILLNEYEIAKGCYILNSKPRVLTLELTNKCNLKCIMCEYKNIKKHWEIPKKIYDELLQIIPYLENLILQGGEVFLYKDILNILKIAVKEKVSVEIVTNGLLLNEEIINILIKGNNIITFSIDSIKKNIYESIRINGKFEKLIENLDKLIKIKETNNSNIILRLHMVVMRRNYKEIEEIINFAAKYGFNEVYLEPVANRYIEQEESIFEFGYDEKIVSLLENKKSVFYDLAKKNNIKLINHLPSTKFCESIIKAESNLNNSKTNKNLFWIFKRREEKNTNYNYTNKIYDKNILYNNIDLKSVHLFCYAPWHKLSVFGMNNFLPTCFCPIQQSEIILNPIIEYVKFFIKNKLSDYSILKFWNSKSMVYYRKAILLNKENLVCAEDCLKNRINSKERQILYK